MGDVSSIQWTEATWNPVAGCRKVSPGCDRCYAIRDAHRLAGNPNPKVAAVYEGLTMIQNGRTNWTGKVRELPDRLDQPLLWTRPRRIFVNSMSDLFHEDVSHEFIKRVFNTMVRADWHTFQILTKRPERMLGFAEWWAMQYCDPIPRHIWLGTSVEDEVRSDRILCLQQMPARVCFLSLEPLLGPLPDLCLEGIDWVIVGGESGYGARPMKASWVRDIIRQCRAAGVPVFVKQMGSVWAQKHHAEDRKGGYIEEWPEDLRVREFPP